MDTGQSLQFQTSRENALVYWLNRPLSKWWCAFSWMFATVPLLAPSTLYGGPSTNDAFESVLSTWAIAHGHMSCVFPPGTPPHEPGIAPLYPLFSGGVAD